MTSHKITYFTQGDTIYASCSCRGWSSAHHPARQAVEDEAFRHLRNVEKARAAQHTSTPSLASQRNWYRKQADDPKVPVEQRERWGLLADELDRRLGASHIGEDVALPFD